MSNVFPAARTRINRLSSRLVDRKQPIVQSHSNTRSWLRDKPRHRLGYFSAIVCFFTTVVVLSSDQCVRHSSRSLREIPESESGVLLSSEKKGSTEHFVTFDKLATSLHKFPSHLSNFYKPNKFETWQNRTSLKRITYSKRIVRRSVTSTAAKRRLFRHRYRCHNADNIMTHDRPRKKAAR